MQWPSLFRRSASQLSDEFSNLTAEGQTYFGQVLAEYQLLPPTATPTPGESNVRKIADDISTKKPEERVWADLFELETCVVKLQSELDLRRSAWAIRAKYRDLAGDKDYDAYQASSPPDPKTGNVEELRADTLQILGEFHWIYAFTPVRERIRNSLAKKVFAITIVFVCIACAITAYGYFAKPGRRTSTVYKTPPSTPVLPIVIAMGMVGGYISLQRRIQAVPSTGDPIVNIAELSNSQFSVFLAPLSGAVFAVLLYVIFIGGLLKGPLFPVISTTEGACDTFGGSDIASPTSPQSTPAAGPGNTSNSGSDSPPNPVTAPKDQDRKTECVRILSFSDFVIHTGPASGVQFAILLVWAFIAGFAERFVPDTIDRLVSQAVQE